MAKITVRLLRSIYWVLSKLFNKQRAQRMTIAIARWPQKLTSFFKAIFSSLAAFIKHLPQYPIKTKALARKTIQTTTKAIKNPKKTAIALAKSLQTTIHNTIRWLRLHPIVLKTGGGLIVVIMVGFSYFHFYYASPQRIASLLEQAQNNTQTSYSALRDITYSAPGTDLQATTEQLQQASAAAENYNNPLPRDFVILYAFRNVPNKQQELDRLQTSNPAQLADDTQHMSQAFQSLITSSHTIQNANYNDLAQDEAKNTAQQIASVRNNIANSNTSHLPARSVITINRILEQLQAEAELFANKGDKQRWNNEAAVLQQELNKTVNELWTQLQNRYQREYSQIISDYERLRYLLLDQ